MLFCSLLFSFGLQLFSFYFFVYFLLPVVKKLCESFLVWNIANIYIATFSRATKCFQCVLKEFPRRLKAFQKGFQTVSKGFPKRFKRVSKAFQKGFQSVLKGFPKSFKEFQSISKGLQSVSKGFPKSFKAFPKGFNPSETGFPKGFTATSNPLANAFVDKTCFRMECHICHIEMYYFCLQNVHDLKIQSLDNKKKPCSAKTLERINSERSPLPPHFNFNSPWLSISID